ncbi:MAG: thymidine kinase [Candidatus Harrisonbacteria bacterium CG10_big_fil_rev_8_21_14_0_10_42_17]|uniref:Thymidine kinase n=1 Tax=Candidatus Harrisonbacteria bacterium CG10_big_fil_rev_8_21_14_0_10_42_17 TaxID=1974584 RepID=A0A2M6WHZ0_9BACT|nr:MAG: thymidine kinase [Candidatus Harrisonbacteria bacterium CG10_big_fil_rev_8_21_14_0_10_42_17]
MNATRPFVVFTGTMFSGKTDLLCQTLRRLSTYSHQRVVVFKPTTDRRSSNGHIQTADGVQMPAHEIKPNRPEKILRMVYQMKADGNNPDVLGFDEIQFFFPALFAAVTAELYREGYQIYAAGLDLDFRGEPFETASLLLAHATYIHKLESYCARCGQPARLPQRLIEGSPASYTADRILIGGTEAYEARCTACHVVPDRPSVVTVSIAPHHTRKKKHKRDKKKRPF